MHRFIFSHPQVISKKNRSVTKRTLKVDGVYGVGDAELVTRSPVT